MTQSVSNEQIDYVFKQLKITGWPHAAAVTLAALAIWNNQPHFGIVIWFVVLQTSHMMRLVVLDPLWTKIKNADKDYQYVRLFLSLGMFSTGCVWAVIPVFYLNDPQSEFFVFISIASAGMICATLPALAAYLPAYLCFVVPIFAALIVRYFQLGMGLSAFLTVSFLGAMVGISYIINGIITRSITIDFKNQRLLGEVMEAKEAAEQANQAKSRFLAAASHDLRQPLQALGLLLESIQYRLAKGEDAVRPLVRQALESHDALSALLNALLELSRLESHDLDVQDVALPIKDFAKSLSSEFEPNATAKGLTIEVTGEDVIVRTDPVLFGRVLRNLLSNAIKFTHAGKIRVDIRCCDHEAVLTVIDTGMGIPFGEQDRIFDEYYQVSNEARNRQEGIGLGLSVVKKMCELLGHATELRSELGKGTRFSIHLPKGTLAEKTISEEIRPCKMEGYKVLVLDDEVSVLSAVAMLMEDWKCECLLADTIETAIDRMRQDQFQPDIILSDYRLGAGVTGIDAINAVRAALCKPVPAILMSGDTDPALVRRIREQSYYLIHKPVKPAHLRKSIGQLLA